MALTGVLVGAGTAIVHSGAIDGWDRRVTSVIVAHRTPWLDTAMQAVTWLGSWIAVVVAGCLIVALALMRRIPWAIVVFTGLAWAARAGGSGLAKVVVGRARPPRSLWVVPAHGSAFPSGHAGTAVVVGASLAVVAAYLTKNRLLAVCGWLGAGLIVAAVAFSRIELGVHWATDVIAGVVYGALCCLGAALTVRGAAGDRTLFSVGGAGAPAGARM